MRISVVVPVYNEARRIVPSLEQIFLFMGQRYPDYEVLVVDDGSSDNTIDTVSRNFRAHDELRLLSYGGNRGKGFAVRFGAEETAGDAILFTDADLSTPIQELDKLIPLYERGIDVVMGSRTHRDSDVRIPQGFYRAQGGKVFNTFVRLLLLDDFGDTQCGFKLLRRASVLPILRRQRINRFAFDVEMLYLARAAGLTIADAPVVWMNSPESKVRPIRDPLHMMLDLLRIWARRVSGLDRPVL